METAFFYIYSTIPQVLGAIVALSGVFLLTKFTSLKKTIISFGQQTIDYCNHDPLFVKMKPIGIDDYIKRMNHGILREDMETVASQMRGIVREYEEKGLFSESPKAKIKQELILNTMTHNNEIQWSCLKLYQSLRSKLKKVLIHSGLLIVLSISMLFLVPIIVCCLDPIIGNLIFIGIIIWTAYCLWLIGYLIFISLTRDY